MKTRRRLRLRLCPVCGGVVTRRAGVTFDEYGLRRHSKKWCRWHRLRLASMARHGDESAAELLRALDKMRRRA